MGLRFGITGAGSATGSIIVAIYAHLSTAEITSAYPA
jgi:hypothetical protein